ncbi:MAG: 30S ribosomal protein S1 [Rickettsiales bacterium]
MKLSRYVTHAVEGADEILAGQEDFATLLDQDKNVSEQKREGSLVSGTILSLDRRRGEALVDIGFKTEGYVNLGEFTENPSADDLEPGRKIEVYIERLENNRGYAVLSREKAIRQRTWDHLQNNYKEGDVIDGVIFGRVKGGFTVDLSGVAAFLPGSQVDIRPLRDVSALMNVKQPFQILKMDNLQGNIVVSRRAILEESRREEREEMLSSVREGMEFDGIVKNITDYGAFIDLGSVDGLLHVTDISWSRISHPTEVLSLGQTVRVKVVKFNPENKRISLGMKQLQENPWVGIQERYPKGAKCTGKVTNITDYGVFVEIEDGVEGLVHVSEISWMKQNTHPAKFVSVGETVEVMVLNVDVQKHRISLGMKQCTENPWAQFAEKHHVGQRLKGAIKNVVDFGMFVGLDNNIDGLVHVSDLTWAENGEEELKKFTPGQEIEVVILSIEPDKERISLGVKQLTGNPKQDAAEALKKGETVTCTVDEVTNDGIYVVVDGGVRCFIKRTDLSADRTEQRPDRFAVKDRVDAKIVSLDKKNGAANLSIRALELDEQKRVIQEYGSTDSGASLGEILGAALNSSREAAEKQDKK